MSKLKIIEKKNILAFMMLYLIFIHNRLVNWVTYTNIYIIISCSCINLIRLKYVSFIGYIIPGNGTKYAINFYYVYSVNELIFGYIRGTPVFYDNNIFNCVLSKQTKHINQKKNLTVEQAFTIPCNFVLGLA